MAEPPQCVPSCGSCGTGATGPGARTTGARRRTPGCRWGLCCHAPDHPRLPAVLAVDHCITNFPAGVLPSRTSREDGAIVGDGANQLLPGTYEYRYQGYDGDNRVNGYACGLVLNRGEDNEQSVEVPYGKPFIFRFFRYHGTVNLYSLQNDARYNCWYSALYRIGD